MSTYILTSIVEAESMNDARAKIKAGATGAFHDVTVIRDEVTPDRIATAIVGTAEMFRKHYRP